MRLYIYILIAALISTGLFCCYDENEYLSSSQNMLFQREGPADSVFNRPRVNEKKDKLFKKKINEFIEKNKGSLYLFDFGSNQSPYIEGSVVVTPYNRSVYHRWINNAGIVDADQMLINPLFTDFLIGSSGNELLLYIPSGEYEITFISGSRNSDILPFKVQLNGEEYKIYSKEFPDFASKRGYLAFNTINKFIKTDEGSLNIKFVDEWLVNAVILQQKTSFEVKKYTKLPVYNYRADFYNLLTRDNAIKWSKKFGYDYHTNWDYVIFRTNEIINAAGLNEISNFEKLKFMANYVDRLTRETCCEIPEIDILNSPVDILDPDGFKKGSCFGMARLVGILANSYGFPARLVMYFIDSDFAEFPSLFPQITSPLFLTRNNFPYNTFAIGGYNHTEVEVFYDEKWRLLTNYTFEEHISEYSVVDVINNRYIPSKKRSFYDNVRDVLFVNLYIANTNRDPDYCSLPYSYAFYDLDTATSIYPENSVWTFKTDNHITAMNSLRIGRYWSIRGVLELQYNWVKRIGRELFVPRLEPEEKVILNIMVSGSNRSLEENLNLYINGIKVDYKPYDIVRNFDFAEREGGIFQFRILIDKDRILQERLNSFDIELKDANSKVSIVIGTNDNRISDYDTFTMDYCNQWDMMRSSNSYYYNGPNRYYLYNNPLIFLEIIK